MILNDETTWPVDVVQYLEHYYDLFLSWTLRREDRNAAPISDERARAFAFEYERAIYGLHDILSAYTLDGGYHCTRLTEAEIHHLVSNGMGLPNKAMLCERIQNLQDAGLLEPRVADRLRQINQAGETNRAGMIWFCFYPPHIAGQGGIERLLRSWGGEALYSSHERDPLTGPILRGIGTPCLIEATVPIASLPLHTFLENHLYLQFLINRGLQTTEPTCHENRATHPIPAQNIRRIVRFEESDFVTLTNCNTWTPPLT
jgi:hypothetical protein